MKKTLHKIRKNRIETIRELIFNINHPTIFFNTDVVEIMDLRR